MDSEKAFLDESAQRQGKTPEQAEEDDRRFWLGEDDE